MEVAKFLNNKKGFIVSKYITKPHLINGYKYDMRVYVLVVSFDPLVIYMYKDGLVRFATEKYSLKSNGLSHQWIHLTNYSVNKKSEGYVKNQEKDVETEEKANEEKEHTSKWSYSQLKAKLIAEGANWDRIENEIKDVMIKTIISVESIIVHQMNINTKHK